jgi:8-oxo-dGTP pyrophosphatase MutT (NUDIX family)
VAGDRRIFHRAAQPAIWLAVSREWETLRAMVGIAMPRGAKRQAMHRQALLGLLDRYLVAHPDEPEFATRIRSLVIGHPNCFERDCLPGHITASSWIVSHDFSRVLFTHHRKLDRWLQLGGHADGESNVLEVALNEAREESGMTSFEVLWPGDSQVPFDLDVHRIPALGEVPEHEHHDVRFFLLAGADQELVISDESNDLRWFPIDQLDEVLVEESLCRLDRKARSLIRSWA